MMRAETKAIDRVGRPTSEELDALRLRLSPGGAADVRAHGAVTLDDIAETLGLSPDAVRDELGRIRAERAIRPEAPPRKDQRGLFVFALVLLAAAYPIHLLNPRKLSDEERMAQMQEKLADYQARRKAHPVVHYPILKKVETGNLPPSGFDMTFKGELTSTTASGKGPSVLQRDAAMRALSEAFVNAYEVARDAERSAPKPDKRLPSPRNAPFGTNANRPDPGHLAYTIGTNGFVTQSTIAIDATAGEDWVRDQARSTAAGILDGMARSQAASLKLEPPRWGNIVVPPAGYAITFEGRQGQYAGSAGRVLLPYDADAVARKLEYDLRYLLWQEAEPSDSPFPEAAELAKRPVPGFSKVRITGPRGEVAFRLPIGPSSEYPTAAAAARAADGAIRSAARAAAAQVGPLSPEVAVP